MASYLTKNPIHLTPTELKKSSKWRKYIHSIHTSLVNQNMCLVYKNNVKFVYKSNISDITIVFQCRFEGDHSRRECQILIFNTGFHIYYYKCKTPKKLYNTIRWFRF